MGKIVCYELQAIWIIQQLVTETALLVATKPKGGDNMDHYRGMKETIVQYKG